MDKAEVVLLLTLAATFDYRRIGEADVEAWYLALDDIDLDDAKAAVVRHYRDQTDRLMPAHVRAGVKAIRAERRRLEPSEALQLPSKFEDDMNRQVRMQAGGAHVREVLAAVGHHLEAQSPPSVSAMDQLRALTAGPNWDADASEVSGE
ncbi:hypothetical protein ACWT_5699 [Actinoplanes sp. SE50]|uniref:hypothetical protein n=1 Tax=unclassified Actinoplanes TaxID=2626549 RepID=UPI00023ED2E2|nr:MULTISPECIES: hypothetical protein [unclassified Actinoplanes]AEV86716.1 hypothetical protein ACPL_5829 [Actinoplanes sp. SE50/110]ATO85114.1 hypothetical protein ACWT_5699 [Actinoplanes sp. SE50]SLM02525.1 hypothetical protein ACSP50_5775 [Actinoplanes sp. SE50/110]